MCNKSHERALNDFGRGNVDAEGGKLFESYGEELSKYVTRRGKLGRVYRYTGPGLN